MHRRKLLSCLALSALSGCSGANVGASGGEPATATATAQDVGALEVGFQAWYAVAAVRYYDSTADEMAHLHPKHDHWAHAVVKIENLQTDDQDKPDLSDFSIILSDGEFSPVEEWPEIESGQIRPENKTHLWQLSTFPGDHVAQGTLGGGQSVKYSLLFDVPSADSPVLEYQDSVRLSPAGR